MSYDAGQPLMINDAASGTVEITRDPTPDEIAVHEQQVIVAMTAARIGMRTQPLRTRVQRFGLKARKAALARKVERAGVRSAAGLSRR